MHKSLVFHPSHRTKSPEKQINKKGWTHVHRIHLHFIQCINNKFQFHCILWRTSAAIQWDTLGHYMRGAWCIQRTLAQLCRGMASLAASWPGTRLASPDTSQCNAPIKPEYWLGHFIHISHRHPQNDPTYRVSRIILDKLNKVFFGEIITFELIIAPFPCWFSRHFEREADEL